MRLLLLFFLIYSGSQAQSTWKATTAQDREAGEQRRKNLEKRSYLNKVSFRNVGPSITSGRVVDLEANPANPSEFYVAYASGGLWYSENNGQSFVCISDNMPHTFMGEVAVNWKENILWLGTGEPNALRTAYAGNGVYKTRDKGKTWEYLGLPESHHIGKIELHPANAQKAWVAADGHLYSVNKERGIYMTNDGGKSWKHTLYIDDTTGAIDVVVDPANPDILYAAMWHRTRSAWNLVESGRTSGIYKSTNGGETWQLISGPKSGFPIGNGVGRIGLSIYPKDPNIIYAVVDHFSSRPDTSRRDTSRNVKPANVYTASDFQRLTKEQFSRLDDKKLDSFLREKRLDKYKASDIKARVAQDKFKPTVIADFLGVAEPAPNVIGAEVYRSSNGGLSWNRTHTQLLDNTYSYYGYFFGKIWVSPRNPDKIVIAGVPLLLSENGGKTFKDIGKANVHGDHHALWFNPLDDNHMINGNDGGVNISVDNGAHWLKANTPPVSQFYSVEVDNADPYNIYGGMQDNGVWYGPSNYKADIAWHSSGQYPYKSIGGGDGMQVQADWRDNKTYYAGSQFGAYFRAGFNENAKRINVRPTIELGEKPLRFNWLTPILLSRHNQDVLYVGSNRFHRSLNKGEKMENLSGDLTNGGKKGDVPYGTITALSESPLHFGLLYAGTDDGNIHVSSDGGYSWSKISAELPAGLWVSRISASAHKEGRVYASLTGYRLDHFKPYLFVSEDYGRKWKRIGEELPEEPVNVIKEDLKNEDILYIGTDNGLYVTVDRGASFMAWTGGLPRVPVYDIAIQHRENDIVLGTHGRSVYVAKLSLVQQLTPSLMQKDLVIADLVVQRKPEPSRQPPVTIGPTSIQIAYFVRASAMTDISIKSQDGLLLKAVRDTAAMGFNMVNIDLDLAKGTYSLEVGLPGGSKQIKSFAVKSD